MWSTGMKLGIMQPYFLPYIGYFQLIAAVDTFIIYDNIKYTKKGWINRNRMLQNCKDAVFSLQLKKDSDYLNVAQRELSADFSREKLLNKFQGAYIKAPFFKEVFPLLQNIIYYPDNNLFRYIQHSLIQVCDYLNINTHIRISSEVLVDNDLKGQDKVLGICDVMGADTYINMIGGLELYDRDIFRSRNIDLFFIKSLEFEYPQFCSDFVPWLSILDVLMFNSPETVHTTIYSQYELI